MTLSFNKFPSVYLFDRYYKNKYKVYLNMAGDENFNVTTVNFWFEYVDHNKMQKNLLKFFLKY